MSTLLAVQGFYDNIPASILLDPTTDASHLSLAFTVAHALPRTVRIARGSVAVQTATGPVFVHTRTGRYASAFSIPVTSFSEYDVILGKDWFLATACRMHDGLVLDPMPGSVLALGHSWSSSPSPPMAGTLLSYTLGNGESSTSVNAREAMSRVALAGALPPDDSSSGVESSSSSLSTGGTSATPHDC